jgi:general secretion pathway protein D
VISGQDASNNDQFMKVNAFLGSADLSMILHMLSQRTDTDLLSAPKVLTRPGENAVIKVVTEYIYPTDYNVQLQSSSSSSSYSGGSQSAVLAVVEPEQFEKREVGVILDVTPTLTDDGNLIDLELDTKVVDEPTWKNYGMKIPYSGNSSSLESFTGIGEIFSSLSDLIANVGGELPASTRQMIVDNATVSAIGAMDSLSSSGDKNMTYYEAPMEQPFFHVRSISSKVSIFPGATIVMGGLITESRQAIDDKVPFLGDLPFIGRLFRSHAEETVKKNLLIFVTTRLVDVRGREVSVGGGAESSSDVKPAPETASN